MLHKQGIKLKTWYKKYNMKIDYIGLKTELESRDYIFFDKGDYNINIIFERTSDEYSNMFTDKLHIAYRENGVPKVVTIRATTKPGLKGSILNPITVGGVTGTAVIIPNQYRSAYRYVDINIGNMDFITSNYPFFYKQGHKQTPYFQQIKGLNYWRDFDKDLVIDEVQEQDNKLFGTHIHSMGEPINNWSLGCMGFSLPDMIYTVSPILKQAIALYGRDFTVTIIDNN